MGRLRQVRDRSGQLVPFSQARIAGAIREAVALCGLDPGYLAEELAAVVTLFLEKHHADANPPSVAEIDVMIEKVLTETGHVRVARAYARLAVRRVARTEAGGGPECMAPLEVLSGQDHLLAPWDVERIVRSLRQEAGLPEDEARDVASGVEAKIRKSGLGRVTTSLVREFVDVELVQRGRDQAHRAHRLLGASRRDVESWLLPTDGVGDDPEERCARAVLEAWSLDEMHSAPVSQAHVDGRLHLYGLGHPHRVEELTLDATGPLFPVARNPDDFLLGLVTLLQSVRPLVRRRIVISRFAEAFAALPKPGGRRAVGAFVKRLVDHLLKVDVFGRPVFPPVALEVHLTGDHLADGPGRATDTVAGLADALLHELEVRPALRGALGLIFLLRATRPYAWPESKTLDRLLRAARRHSGVALDLLRDDEAARRGTTRAGRERVLLDVGAVAIDVPYALALADVKSAEEITDAIESTFDLAIEALFEKYWFLRRAAPETLKGLLRRLPGGESLRIEGAGQGGQIRLWGLGQALAWLKSRGIVVAGEEPAVLARILACAEFLAGEERESIRLRITLGGVTERDVRARFLASLEGLSRQLGITGLRESLAAPDQDGGVLPLLSPLFSPANGPVLNGRFLDRLGPGLPLPARGEDDVTNGVWLTHLFESTRLSYVELEERRELFEVQEGLFGEEVAPA